MKRVAGAVLFGIGVFLLVLAPLTWLYVAPSLVKAPLNQNTTTVAEAPHATYLRADKDKGTLEIKTDDPIRATRVVRGDVKAGDLDRTIYDVGVVVSSDTDNFLVKAYTDRVASDRRTAEAVHCCSENVDGDRQAHHDGLTYKFPFSTEKTDYRFFDTTMKKSYPMKFKDTTTIKGLEVYRFQQVITEQKSELPPGQQDVPGSLVGKPGVASVHPDLIYNNTRTVWVEPVTGSIVKGQEIQKQVLRVDGNDTTVLEATLTFNDKTVTDLSKNADEQRAQVKLFTQILPLGLLFLGLVLVVLGGVLVRKPRHIGLRRAEGRPREALDA